MATSRWRSSLANIEARLRRSLGIAGPIGLELTDPLPLLPVVLADDSTRPGAASDFRGRRFAIPFELTISGSGFGSYAFRTDCPSGVVIDALELSGFIVGAGAAVPLSWEVQYGSIAQVQAVPPYALVTRDGQMVDPMNTNNDRPPIFAGSSSTITATWQRIWSLRWNAYNTPYTIPLSLWLPNGAGLSAQNTVAAPLAGAILNGVYHGRVF